MQQTLNIPRNHTILQCNDQLQTIPMPLTNQHQRQDKKALIIQSEIKI